MINYLKFFNSYNEFFISYDRSTKKLNRTNTYNIADKRACKRSSSVDKHSKQYKNKKFDRDCKYLLY